jgi:CheY-like chemotaxis protein
MMKNKILVIEDNLPIRKLFSTLLKKQGFEVDAFGFASESLEWVKENTPDIVLMDILLSDMNGTELIKEMKNLPHLKDSVFIAVTGFATGNDKNKFLEMGFTGYLSKPVNTKTFADDINDIINN